MSASASPARFFRAVSWRKEARADKRASAALALFSGVIAGKYCNKRCITPQRRKTSRGAAACPLARAHAREGVKTRAVSSAIGAVQSQSGNAKGAAAAASSNTAAPAGAPLPCETKRRTFSPLFQNAGTSTNFASLPSAASIILNQQSESGFCVL